MLADPVASPSPPVSPDILRLVGDVARPQRPVPFNRDLGHLPGKSGLLAGIQTVAGMMRQGEVYFSGLVQQHGPVFRHMLGPDPMVCVADPDLAWSILRNEDGGWSAALSWVHFFSGLDASGPAMHDLEPHRELRRMLQPAFGGPALAGYLAAAQEVYARGIDEWMRRGRVRFKAEVRQLFASVSARIFMGIEGAADAKRLDHAMTEGWQAVLALRKRSALSIGWRRARHGIESVWQIMRERRGGGTDLLSRMRETRDEATWLDDEHTRLRIFIGIMFAAFDTTASGTTSMAYLLAKHPEWQERLRAEARTVTAERPGLEELKVLEQQDWAWKESLRLYPVAGQVSRVALREMPLGAQRVPPSALVLVLTGTLSRDPRWWTDPLRFDPERFSPARAEDKRHKAIFLPFGAGAHACIGAQLAGVEVRAFWHALLRRCRFRLRKDYTARHGYLPVGMVSGDVELELERI
jgi:cytochrome P450